MASIGEVCQITCSNNPQSLTRKTNHDNQTTLRLTLTRVVAPGDSYLSTNKGQANPIKRWCSQVNSWEDLTDANAKEAGLMQDDIYYSTV